MFLSEIYLKIGKQRHKGGKWSRQSEELPILICRSKLYFQERYADDSHYPNIDKIGLQGGAMNISICTENDHIDEDIKLFDDCLHKDDEILSERLNVLSRILKDLGK